MGCGIILWLLYPVCLPDSHATQYCQNIKRDGLGQSPVGKFFMYCYYVNNLKCLYNIDCDFYSSKNDSLQIKIVAFFLFLLKTKILVTNNSQSMF